MALGSELPVVIVTHGATKLKYLTFGAGRRQISHTRFCIMEGLAKVAVSDLLMGSLTWVVPR